MLIITAVFFLAILTAAYGHLTLTPNYGAASNSYFKSTLKIPHGTSSKETTKIEVTIPHGVLSATPEALYGWEITTTTRPIAPYISHGHTVNTAPATITWTAICTGSGAPWTCDNPDHAGLDHSHLLELSIQLKLGCDFGIDMNGDATSDATIWMDQYTLWFPSRQWVSTPGTNDGNADDAAGVLEWTGVVSGTSSWGAALPKPSPYIFIYSTEDCVDEVSTSATSASGMRWGITSTVVPPEPHQDIVKSKQEVLSWMDEMNLELQENFESKIDSSVLMAKSASMVAIAAACLSGVMSLMILSLLFIRLKNPMSFKKFLLSDAQYSKADASDDMKL